MLDRIALITGNAGKAAEYAAMLGIDVTPAKAELTEVQSLDVAVVAARKVTDAYAQLGEPILVDDTGLTIHAWNGLPGALVAWFLDTVGAQGILNMAAELIDRRATVTTALGYADADGVQVFTGTVNGTLATEPRGTSGFGYDAIFIPDTDPGHRTYAQMTSEEKNKISHRRRAVEVIAHWTGTSLATRSRARTRGLDSQWDWLQPSRPVAIRDPSRTLRQRADVQAVRDFTAEVRERLPAAAGHAAPR
jgi:XTP/dITP diphosphohydrolase